MSRWALLLVVLLGADQANAVTVSREWVRHTSNPRRSLLGPQERSAPVIVGDILFVATLDGRVTALHRVGGYPLWEKKVKGAVEGSIAYGRSKLVVGDLAGNLICLNARNGEEVWSFKAPAEWLAPVAIGRDQVVGIASNDDVYAVSLDTGKLLWSYSHRGDERMTVRGTASPVIFAGEVFAGFSDGYVAALSGARGEELWTKSLRSRDRFYDVDMTAYVDEKSVITGSFDGRLYRLNRVNGETQWVFPVGSMSGVLVSDGKVFFSGLNRHFYALDYNTGQLIWKTPYDSGVGLRPARLGKHLVFATSDDPLYLLEAASGKVVWRGRLGAGTLAQPTAQEDWFYLLSNYGNVFSFQLRDTVPTPLVTETVSMGSALFKR